jgi:hypothetical protein
VLLHFQTAHVPRPNVYCTAVYGLRVQGTELSVWVCDGTVAGTSTCSGTWGAIACGPSPESLVSSAAKRFDTTSGDVDVSLATFAVLRSPGLKAIKTLDPGRQVGMRTSAAAC